MLIAVVSNTSTYDSVIPERFGDAESLWIIETDDMRPESVFTKTADDPDLFPREIVAYNVEAVVCGMMTKDEFDPVANASITRFNGSGLTVAEAAHAAVYNALPYITDHEGGNGCPSHSPQTNCHSHSLQLAASL